MKRTRLIPDGRSASSPVVHRRGLKIRSLFDCIPGASSESFYKAEGISLSENGPLDIAGNRIYFCHWPGIIGLPKRRLFDELWHGFSRQAAARMKASA